MIDNFFIESTQNIRNRVLEQDEKLNEYTLLVKELHDQLIDCHDRLLKIVNDNKNKNSTKEDLLKIADIFSKEMIRLEESIKENEKKRSYFENAKIELIKEEMNLWDKIKNKYPDLPDDEIVSYIKSKII